MEGVEDKLPGSDTQVVGCTGVMGGGSWNNVVKCLSISKSLRWGVDHKLHLLISLVIDSNFRYQCHSGRLLYLHEYNISSVIKKKVTAGSPSQTSDVLSSPFMLMLEAQCIKYIRSY